MAKTEMHIAQTRSPRSPRTPSAGHECEAPRCGRCHPDAEGATVAANRRVVLRPKGTVTVLLGHAKRKGSDGCYLETCES